ARRGVPASRSDEFSQRRRRLQEFSRKRVSQLIEDARELSLQVLREDGVRDRPADNGEMLRPRTRWDCTTEVPLELAITISNPVTIPVLRPSRCLLLEGLPVLVTRVPVAEFRRVDDPRQCVVSRRRP